MGGAEQCLTTFSKRCWVKEKGICPCCSAAAPACPARLHSTQTMAKRSFSTRSTSIVQPRPLSKGVTRAPTSTTDADGFEIEAAVGFGENFAIDDAGVVADRDELHLVARDLMVRGGRR